MKKTIAVFLCFLLLGSLMLPVLATEATDPSQPPQTPAPVPYASHVMAVFCAVVAIAGGIYLMIVWKKSRKL